MEQAREALTYPLAERRRRFTFVARYSGPWPTYSDSDAETGHLPGGKWSHGPGGDGGGGPMEGGLGGEGKILADGDVGRDN